ncbi:DUF3237 domain-containing protein [Jatrophihabitans sp. GAS493]|uniref:DUF3237 domain-containing protein n=1 Tax=Jatrophihabitans sp. GAS493 TaxID=1907575 RepID=UPI0012FDC450|nr:DUF3237 domain-containing protein [Jatrophihabitans sp. GAS493]
MDLEPLCRFTAYLNRPEMVADTPRGRRLIGPIVRAELTGDRFHATQAGTSAADWLVMGPDGTTFIDVRIAFRTDDGARLFMSYLGRADWSGGVMSAPVFSTPVFETAHPDYAWLNRVLCVGKGSVFEGGAEYELAVLR